MGGQLRGWGDVGPIDGATMKGVLGLTLSEAGGRAGRGAVGLTRGRSPAEEGAGAAGSERLREAVAGNGKGGLEGFCRQADRGEGKLGRWEYQTLRKPGRQSRLPESQRRNNKEIRSGCFTRSVTFGGTGGGEEWGRTRRPAVPVRKEPLRGRAGAGDDVLGRCGRWDSLTGRSCDLPGGLDEGTTIRRRDTVVLGQTEVPGRPPLACLTSCATPLLI